MQEDIVQSIRALRPAFKHHSNLKTYKLTKKNSSSVNLLYRE